MGCGVAAPARRARSQRDRAAREDVSGCQCDGPHYVTLLDPIAPPDVWHYVTIVYKGEGTLEHYATSITCTAGHTYERRHMQAKAELALWMEIRDVSPDLFAACKARGWTPV